MHRLTPLLAAALAFPSATARAETFELRSGFDVFTRDQSAITALHSLSLMGEVWTGGYVGGSLYSAAAGDGGGLFIGGFEFLQQLQLGPRTALEVSGFVGGGGGATVVKGDGLMTRGYVGVRQGISDRFSAALGLAYINVTGSPISTPAVSFGFAGPLGLALIGGAEPARPTPGGTAFSALTPLAMVYFPQASTGRGGGPVDTMGLVGAELSFSPGPGAGHESFIRAAGAAAGDGAGYAEWIYGWRWRTPSGPAGLSGFAELGAGFAGGGGVDTGGGAVVAAGAGLSLPVFGAVQAELGGGAVKALGGDFFALSAFARAAIRFGSSAHAAPGQGVTTRHWQLSSGLSAQIEHDGLRPAGSTLSGSPVLAAFSIDLFLDNHIYLFGDAQTALTGEAGAYALGAMGLGYRLPFGDSRWAMSGEAYVGAAAGAGIATGDGLIGGGRLEVDYALSDRVSLSAGVGKFYSGGTAQPVTVSFGLKMPFTTYH